MGTSKKAAFLQEGASAMNRKRSHVFACCFLLIATTFACSWKPKELIPRTSSELQGKPVPAFRGEVRVCAMCEPKDADLIAIVEVHCQSSEIDALVGALRAETAKVGGDLLRIDQIKMKRDTEEVCNNAHECKEFEVAIFQVVGRALRTRKSNDP